MEDQRRKRRSKDGFKQARERCYLTSSLELIKFKLEASVSLENVILTDVSGWLPVLVTRVFDFLP